jgi:Xaa-Pro aminopeptidase
MDVEKYRKVQNAAKSVHDQLFTLIDSESTEAFIVEAASDLLRDHGITETWYHGISAFVLLGSRSCTSISGRDYHP